MGQIEAKGNKRKNERERLDGKQWWRWSWWRGWVREKKTKTKQEERTKENQKRKMMEVQAKPQQTPEEIKKSDEET